MTRPTVYLVRMVVFLIAVGAVAVLLSPVLINAFHNNPGLNSFILFVLALGIAWNLRQVLRLSPEVTWIETFQTARARLASLPTPKLLAPMARMFASRDAERARGEPARITLSTTAMRTLLDGIASRLDESRELSRYMTGLMIFLGLLGTFWGLLKTIGAVSDVIAHMSIGGGDVNTMFEQLKSELAQPLAGMGTAFSASMYGLLGGAGAGVPRPDRGPGAEPLLQRTGGMAGRPDPARLRRAGGRRRLGAGLCAGAAGANGGEP